jgi:DNA polymerase alpha/epsilon subunit B
MAELGDGTQWIGERTKYMTVSAQEDGQLVAERIFNIGKEISKKILRDENKPEGEQLLLSHCDVMSHETVRCLGKITGDRLDQKSCAFIGFDENKSRIVQLDFSKLKPSVQVFPGEICIIGGNNPRGKTFYVSELYSERMLENCAMPGKNELTEPLHIVIASAPFTAADNLLFDYLEKLMMNCQNNKPDVLILTGAFLPIKSQLIFDVAMELDEHFKKMLAGISERVGEDTKVVIVSSVDDINSSACFPTRPYKLRKLRPYPNIFMAPDPSIIDINGVQIGITSVDVTQQLANMEFCV